MNASKRLFKVCSREIMGQNFVVAFAHFSHGFCAILAHTDAMPIPFSRQDKIACLTVTAVDSRAGFCSDRGDKNRI